MKLVRGIRDGVVDPKVSLSTILRKAKILASTLRNDQFRKWVDSELNGYSGDIELPSYRKLVSPVLGNFSGPFGQSVTRYQLPVALLPENFKKLAEAVLLGNPIKEIESLAADGKEGLRHPWPTEAVMLLRDDFKLSGGYVMIEIFQPIVKAQLDGILDAVRNRLLDFLLQLQEIDPKVLDSEKALEGIPKEEVNQVFNVTIHGDHNVLASGSGIEQQVTQEISPYNKEALMAHLAKLGLEQDDLVGLENAIEADGKLKEKKLGKRVVDRLGKITGRAIDGTWKAATAAAPTLITKAISKYYGWG
ncbi:hypothetical protein KA005_43315 [bacterium]|nr:hypothetical protein [bacterium]